MENSPPPHWRDFIELMRLHKPIGIYLLLWPTLWALLVAGKGSPDTKIVLIFIAGVFVMRALGCVINDYFDRDFDRHVSRTRNRPLTAGRVTLREAQALIAGLALLALLLVLQLNRLTILLSLGGALIAVIYPFMKRITHMPQVVLGAAFAWSVPMVFAAQTGSVPQIAWLMFTATVLWTTAYDTMYAMVDRQDDIALGLKSTAILFDEADRLVIGGLQFCVLVCLCLIGYQAELGIYYYAGVVFAAFLAVYQQRLIYNRERDGCFKAFLNNNFFGMVVFVGMFIDYQLRSL